MSFNRIYGIGKTPKAAFYFAKINEIGHHTDTEFLLKTTIKYLKFKDPDKLELLLFRAYNIKAINRERDLTKTEENAYKILVNYYGKQFLKEIYKIYRNKKGNTSICFKVGVYEGGYNIYKFLF